MCSLDCHSSGTGDVTGIATGVSLDANADGIPDECQGGMFEESSGAIAGEDQTTNGGSTDSPQWDALERCLRAYPRHRYSALSDREYLLLILNAMCEEEGYEEYCGWYEFVENLP